MKYIHTLFIYLWTIFATAFLGIITIIVSLFDSRGIFPHLVARLWAKSIIYVSFIKVKVKGLSNIDKNAAYIYMSNHQSNYDIPALLGFLPVQFRWLAKQILFKIPIMGQGMKSVGYMPIDRSNRESAIKSIQNAVETAGKGVSIMIFPEGTRSVDGNIKPFKKGGFFLAVNSKIPIVPLIIRGTRGVMPKGSFIVKRFNITIEILKPIQTTEYNPENKDELLDLVYNIMKEKHEKELPQC